jgi:hypothetical protein
MPTQTLIATQSIAGPYPALPVGAAALDLVFTAVDAVNGNYFVADQVQPAFNGTLGGDIILVFNPTGGALTISFTSQPDAAGRKGDITTYSVGAGVISALKLSQLVGWEDVSNFVYFLGAAGLTVAVLKR